VAEDPTPVTTADPVDRQEQDGSNTTSDPTAAAVALYNSATMMFAIQRSAFSLQDFDAYIL